MLGTPRKIVAPPVSIAALTRRGSKRSAMTRVRPHTSGVSMPTVAAKAWNIGSTSRMRSTPGWNESAAWTLAVLDIRLR